VILDNLSAHKPKRDRWLRRHPNVHLLYTATHASWLNQIEIEFPRSLRVNRSMASHSAASGN
jgi:hypothetical protein